MIRYLKLQDDIVVNVQIGEFLPENSGNITWKERVSDFLGIGWQLNENDWTYDTDQPGAPIRIGLDGEILERNPTEEDSA